MKVLVADSDPNVRVTLLRILSHLEVIAMEAPDGIEAVHSIETTLPDLIVIDSDLPKLNGIETLTAVRNSQDFASLPVVMISGRSDSATVGKMIELGIADFILKPLNTEDTYRRLKSVLHQNVMWKKERAAEASDMAGKLLIVEPDVNYSNFLKSLLDQQFRVFTARSGAEGFRAYRGNLPAVVLTAEKLPLVNEARLVQMIHETALRLDTAPPQVILVTAADQVTDDVAAAFDGVIPKTFVPGDFLEEFNNAVRGQDSLFQVLTRLVGTEMRDHLVSATQHTLGVMTDQDAVVSTTAVEDGPRVVATVNLEQPTEGLKLVLAFACSPAHAALFATSILRREVTETEESKPTIGELVNTIAARVRATLSDRGFALTLSMPEVSVFEATDAAVQQWDITRRFVTAAAQRFEVTLRLAELQRIPDQNESGRVESPDLPEVPEPAEVAPNDEGAANDEVVAANI